MSYSSMADLDAADERERRRAAAREQVRNGSAAAGIADSGYEAIPLAAPEPKPAPAVKPPVPPSPAMMPAHASGPTEPTPPPFRLIGPNLPTARGKGFEAPPIRVQAIAMAIEHPGQWIEYRASAADPFKNASTLAAQARSARGGFREGFTARVIGGVVYLRYDTPTEGTPK